MSKTPILSELYGIRSQILAEHGDDLRGYLHRQFERLRAEGHPIAQIKQRTIRCAGVTNSGGIEVRNQTSPPSDLKR